MESLIPKNITKEQLIDIERDAKDSALLNGKLAKIISK